jgi:hypothetical protein
MEKLGNDMEKWELCDDLLLVPLEVLGTLPLRSILRLAPLGCSEHVFGVSNPVCDHLSA